MSSADTNTAEQVMMYAPSMIPCRKHACMHDQDNEGNDEGSLSSVA